MILFIDCDSFCSLFSFTATFSNIIKLLVWLLISRHKAHTLACWLISFCSFIHWFRFGRFTICIYAVLRDSLDNCPGKDKFHLTWCERNFTIHSTLILQCNVFRLKIKCRTLINLSGIANAGKWKSNTAYMWIFSVESSAYLYTPYDSYHHHHHNHRIYASMFRTFLRFSSVIICSRFIFNSFRVSTFNMHLNIVVDSIRQIVSLFFCFRWKEMNNFCSKWENEINF